jgi:hypothetical protein
VYNVFARRQGAPLTLMAGILFIHSLYHPGQGIAQNGRNTYKSKDMQKITIPNDIRVTLKKTLNKYGIDRFSLFPGLDSLAAHIEWLQSKGY